MLVVVEPHNAGHYRHLVEEMFRLRARVFHDRLKWHVEVTDGMERDRYDDEAPVYLIYTDPEMRAVRGSLRLLPTTGPTLLADTFADTVPDAAGLSAPSIWECTRFCLDERLLDEENREEAVLTSGILFAGLGEVALAAGIESVLGNFDAAMYRLYRRVGCEVEVLGQTERYGRTVYLGLFPVTVPILERVKARLAQARLAPAQLVAGPPLAA